MDIQIRRAGPPDTAALAEVGRDTFVETFGRLYPPEDLEAFLVDSYTPESFARYLGPPGHALWLAEAAGRAVAYVQAGPCTLPHEQVTPACGEVKRLYRRHGFERVGSYQFPVGNTLDDEFILARPGA